jgi:hypothetical protein
MIEKLRMCAWSAMSGYSVEAMGRRRRRGR